MGKQSAGILMYRRINVTEVLLVHPGGPFFAKKDLGSWSIPKGETEPGEEALEVAKREFFEETGTRISGDFIHLGTIRQKGGKEVTAWAIEGDLDADKISSNTFEMEWPPRSGTRRIFPEVDRAAWFPMAEARTKINEKQASFLDQLEMLLRE